MKRTDSKCNLLGVITGELGQWERPLFLLSFFRKGHKAKNESMVSYAPVKFACRINSALTYFYMTHISQCNDNGKCFGFGNSHLENSQGKKYSAYVIILLTYKLALP